MSGACPPGWPGDRGLCMMGDKLPDEIPSGVRWMTYAELG